MKNRFLRLFVLISSLIFSTMMFYLGSVFIEGILKLEPKFINGITGNAVFYNFNNEYKLISYILALFFVPVFSLFICFFWNYLSSRISGNNKRRMLLIRKIVAMPCSIFFFTIPMVFSSGMAAVTASLGIALLLVIFWLYQFGYDSRPRFRFYSVILFFLSLGAILTSFSFDGSPRFFMSPFIFVYIFTGTYLFFEKIRSHANFLLRRLPDVAKEIPFAYHLSILFLGFAMAAFFLTGNISAIFVSFLFWLVVLAISSLMSRTMSIGLKMAAALNIICLSPLVFLYLKIPFFIAVWGRFSADAELKRFQASGVILVAILIFLTYRYCLRTRIYLNGERAKRAITAMYVIAGFIFMYALFFVTNIDVRFDYYHEAEQAARAALFMNSELTFRDMYFFEHGLIQDFGIGWAAFKLFGESLEALRLFNLFLYPLGAVAFFVLSFYTLRSKYLVILTILLAIVIAGNSGPMNFLFSIRFLPACLSLLFFIKHIRTQRLIWILPSSIFTFVSVLWSLDVGTTLLITQALVAIALDLRNAKFRLYKYRSFPVFLGLQAIIFLMFYFGVNKGIINTTVEVLKAQTMAIQLYAHSLPYIKISDTSFRNFYLAYAHPVIIVFSIYIILYRIVSRKWSDENFVFLALTVFSALFFVRAFGRTDTNHLNFASPYIPLISVLAANTVSDITFHNRRHYHAFLIILAFTFSFMPTKVKTFKFVADFPSMKLSYDRPVQDIRTDKIGMVQIGKFQVDGINTVMDFFEKEGNDERWIFDFTNNYGISVWILGKRPVTKSLFTAFYNTSAEQEYIISRLKEIMPRFIIFNSNDWFSQFDNFNNSVRYPLIARYVFRNYVPYARALNFNIMADRSYAGKERYTSRKIATIVEKDISGVIKYGFAGTDIPLPPSINNYRNRYVSVVMSVKGEGTNEYYKDKDIYLINKVRVASVYTDDLTPYQFKLKNSDEFVEYIIPIPDRDITSLKLVPANFRCMFTIRKIAVFSSSGSQYPNTLREWDMFEKTELGYIPYFMGKESRMQEDKTKSLLNHEFERSGNAELNDIGIKTEKVSSMIIEIESVFEKDAVVMWDAGFGYFDDQAVYFKLKNDGRPHRYLIDLSSVASWHYIEHVKNLKISSSSGDKGFRIKKLILFS